MTIECDYGQACLDAFVNCENLLTALSKKTILFYPDLVKILNECAYICMGTFYAIKHSSINATQLAVLCIGICEECAEACENVNDTLFKQCAQVCRYCSHSMIDLATGDSE